MDVRSPHQDVKVVKILNYASGTADRTSGVIDTLGFTTLEVEVDFAAITANAVTNIYLQCADVASDTNTLTSGTNVADSSQTVADSDDNEVFRIIISPPAKRYYQLVVNKDATNAVAESARARLSGAQVVPVTQGAGNTSVIGDGHAAVNQEFLGLGDAGTV
jgi:hypothetical protein